jgi:hypothetical protein
MGRYVVDKAAVAAIPREPAVDRAIQELAGTMLIEARSKVPVKTGALRASGFVDGGNSEYTVGFDESYAAEVEFGTDDSKAQPYLTPATLRSRGSL